ncbi:ATP-binding protein [Actinophytocola xinjiangensis]|uniref:ATP-binding protein n=1 Tax=Actinophytocola xinjiangensis TaxID=485602 RepID=UPI0009FDFCCE|nr:ATP-binding protein [Actinophytocola xinjiangensis]
MIPEQRATRILGEARFEATDHAFLTGLRGWLEGPLDGCTPGVVKEVTIVLGELVANAFQHARPPFAVRLTLPRPGHVVRMEVHDGTVPAPTAWPAGKGLFVVRGLCPDWGVEPRPEGKAVWAELPILVAPTEN